MVDVEKKQRRYTSNMNKENDEKGKQGKNKEKTRKNPERICTAAVRGSGTRCVASVEDLAAL